MATNLVISGKKTLSQDKGFNSYSISQYSFLLQFLAKSSSDLDTCEQDFQNLYWFWITLVQSGVLTCCIKSLKDPFEVILHL